METPLYCWPIPPKLAMVWSQHNSLLCCSLCLPQSLPLLVVCLSASCRSVCLPSTLSVSLSFCISSLVCVFLSLSYMCVSLIPEGSLSLSVTLALVLSTSLLISHAFAHSSFPAISPLPSPDQVLCKDICLSLFCPISGRPCSQGPNLCLGPPQTWAIIP